MLRPLVFVLGLAGAAASHGADSTTTERDPRFFDSDGWFDVSGFLDTAYGFVPLVVPITEPAVGYGAAGALVFIDRNAPGAGQAYSRPNIAAVGGLATENGTRGLFAGHLGNWMDGRLRTLVGFADADVNLDFFGLGGDRLAGSGVAYEIAARGGVLGGSYRLSESPWWVGLRYALAKTTVTFDSPFSDLPGVDPRALDLRLGGLTPSITYDTRNNFFSPTQGWYVDLSVPVFREALGGDVDFDKVGLTAMYYRPLQRSLYFSVRGSAATSSNDTPFYLRPFVWLRGVQMLRYQGDQAGEVEAELRWQFHPRFSVVGFAGAGMARGSPDSRGSQEQSVTSGGAGFRYLIARQHGLQMGVDAGFGPNEPILYIVFGSAWMRP